MNKRIIGKVLLLIFFVLLYVNSLNAQLYINEFMASNTGIVVDPDYDESADWLEIYNGGETPVSLQGYFLTDNFSDLYKWRITTNAEIAPGGFLIIWADGMNAGLHTSFKISASGEELAIVSPSGDVVDSISFESQKPNVSMGREYDGASAWVFFTEPSPGVSNRGESFDGIVKSSPSFSQTGGIYHSPLTVNIRSIFGGTVRYTTDGSEPEESSPIANSPLTISRTTVVRARIFKPGEIPGPVITNTYFIDQDYEIGMLPVVSISTAPDNFWGSENGIYVQDFKPDWEVPVNIELFENDGSDRAAFNEQAGIKVNGLYSWQLPQKMLGVYFRKEYGAGKLDYPLIFEKDRKQYDDFALRASGSDWGSTLFRDGIVQRAAVFNTDLDNSGFRTCVVYVNGEFLGIHNIREKIDEDYIVGNHGLEGGTFDMVEETDRGSVPETGDLVAYTHLFDLAAKDLNNPENWNALADIMDIDDFTDLVCTEAFDGNGSIGHNLMAWKPKEGGKWKWILMDLDRGFPGVTSKLIDFYLRESGWPFGDLMDNSNYQKYFGRRLADLLFTTYNPARIVPMIEEHKQNIDALMPKQIERWAGTRGTGNYSSITAISSYNSWLSDVEYLKTYAQGRAAVLLDDLTNYGFEDSDPITVNTSPDDAGALTFNGLKIPVNQCRGAYPADEEITLTAQAKPGYRFLGWQGSDNIALIPGESVWKYFDRGSEPAGNWKGAEYDDSGWGSGQAELGYGDDDENTTVSYGSSSSNKYVTTYFRKSFNISNKNSVLALEFRLKCDDGAVVYLNGQEIQRQNMPVGTIAFDTFASSTVSSTAESAFTLYTADPSLLVSGQNVIAVEVHQINLTSSDLSFDLELTSHKLSDGNYLSNQNEYAFTMDGEKDITAVFESTGQCLVDAKIDSEVTLVADCSPYAVPGNVTITPSGKLVIEQGVELLLADSVSIYAFGPIVAKGTEENPIYFRSSHESTEGKWGIISFKNVQDTSYFNHVIIEDASHGPHPVREIAAISLFHSNIKMDQISIENVYNNPIVARYSDVTLTNSHLHSSITGDLINVKYGNGYINNCDFYGNDKPDTDAIDYDDVENGVIKNCRIHDFHGLNSDAIDIGEQAQNILIDSVFVYNITDKGVSVGQQSSAIITNSVFTNCNLGAGLKDSCRVTIDHCTYYGNKIAVACYEKNPGDAGGNVLVTNSILSNAYDSTFFCDNKSTVEIRYSASDNDELPDGAGNLFADPAFTNPAGYDFSLLASSPCIGAASEGNMGTALTVPDAEPMPVICQVAYLTEENVDMPEFFAILNPTSSRVDFGGWKVTDGVTFEFPPGASAGAGELVYVTGNASHPFWDNRAKNLFQWDSGRLADEGETILLETDNGIIADGLKYDNKAPWPEFSDAAKAITLNDVNLDNHFGKNWVTSPIDLIVSVERMLVNESSLTLYPNPATGWIIIDGMDEDQNSVDIFSIRGKRIKHSSVSGKTCRLDISELNPGLYLVRAGNRSARLIVEK